MKKIVLLALFGLFAVFGVSADTSPVRQNFENEFVLKPSTFIGNVVLQKTDVCSLKETPIVISFEYQRIPEFEIKNCIYESKLSFESFSQTLLPFGTFSKTTVKFREKYSYDKNFILFASNDKPDKLSKETNLSENYRTVWDVYKEYLKENSWRINVKKISYEQLLEHQVLQT